MKPLHFREKWVIVTGASSGLGREIARQLAFDHGANIVAIARRKDKLEELKTELESGARVLVDAVTADLSRVAEIDQALDRILEKREVYGGVLNAGVTHFGEHRQLEWDAFEKMLHTNVTSLVRMTNRLVSHFREKRTPGGLLLVSSMAGLIPVPYQSAYSGTKAFVTHFGQALSHELDGSGISVTVYAPGGIDTEMTQTDEFAPLRRWNMPADRAARIAISGFCRRDYVCVPGVSNRFGALLARIFPRRWITRQLARTYRNALNRTSLKN